MTNRDLTRDQYTAIQGVINAGRKIAESHPEVAEHYISGRTQREITDLFDFQLKFPRLTRRNVQNAVSYALRGHQGNFDIPAYDGLINDQSELERLAYEHHVESGRRLAQNGKGVHGLSYEEKRVICTRAGKVGGLVNKLNGTGLFGRSQERMIKDGKKGAIGNGYTPWETDEVEYAYQLSQDPAYAHGSKVSNAKIAEEINRAYHKGERIRNSNAVKVAVRRYKKK